MSKKVILNADDFGLTIHHNKAVLEGYQTGILTSASLCTNSDAFYDAVENVLSKCLNLRSGVHLNIMEGKALTNCRLLLDRNGYFNKGYLYLILNQHKKKLQEQIKQEFKAQIEMSLNHNIQIDHLDSHVHTHAIPQIFKIVCNLAKEYNIKYVRTQNEKPYLVYPEFLSYKFAVNLIKIGLLKYYTNQNKKIIKNLNLKTNDYTIGIGYTGMMNSDIVCKGLNKIKEGCVEAIIHPCKYDNSTKNSHFKEFEITQDLILKEKIKKLGFDFVSCKNV